jgi:hypothetical protein
MPRITWPLLNDRPGVRIELVTHDGRSATTFDLHADTGAGAASSAFELILLDRDCWLFGDPEGSFVYLTGAHGGGPYYLFWVRVRIPALAFDADLSAVGVPSIPDGFRGVAGFRMLNRFDYGNFGDPAQFGLER